MLFFKLLYKQWRSYMLRNHVPVPEIDDIPTVICSTFNAGIKCVTSCFSDCYAGFFYTKPGPKLLANQNVTKKLKECIELMASQDNDMIAIRTALKTSMTDVRASYKQTTILLSAYQSQYMIQQPLESYDRNIENRVDMLDHVSELLDTYPKLEPEDETSLDRLNVFYNERDTHHQKVMTLVATYLPETYAALREAQPVLKSPS